MHRAVPKFIGWAALPAVLLVWLAAPGPARSAASGFVRPFAAVRVAFSDRVGGFFRGLFPGGKTRADRVRELTEQVRYLELVSAETDAVREQNRQLRRILGLRPPPDWRIVVADVLIRDPAAWNRDFRIGKGTGDGVVPGALVLFGDSVVGRVTECSERGARVTTLGSAACKLSVALAESGVTGVLTGRPCEDWRAAPVCTVDYLPKDVAVTPGEMVVTSGLGGYTPAGLPVGRIRSSDGGETVQMVDGIRARVTVEPAADFSDILFVAVVCPGSETSPDADPAE